MPLPEHKGAVRLWLWLLGTEWGRAHRWALDGASKCKFRRSQHAARCGSVGSGTCVSLEQACLRLQSYLWFFNKSLMS